MTMTKEIAKYDLQALIDYFNDERGASPICLQYCLDMLNQECEDAISRQAVIDYVKGSEAELGHSTENDLVCEDIMKLPPATPKGEWIHRNDDCNDWLECSECGYGSEGEVKYGEGTNFCPKCGADMRDEQNKSTD